jgi:hypothetical protein
MSMRVEAKLPVVSHHKPAKAKLQVDLKANDPDQKFSRVASNKFLIDGRATNAGRTQSSVRFTIDGKEYKLDLRGGETPNATARRICEALPKGCRGLIQAETCDPEGAMAITIYQYGAKKAQ